MERKEFGKWRVVAELGRGGQGTAYKVREGPDPRDQAIDEIVEGIYVLSSQASTGREHYQGGRKRGDSLLDKKNRTRLKEILQKYDEAGRTAQYGALKLLHEAENPDLMEKAIERLKREIGVLEQVDNSSFLRIVDQKPDERWFVTEFFERGAISKNLQEFAGNLERTLQAFRGLVEAVTILHESGIVHRDIKPDNIFVANDGHLVLGDMGIAFFKTDATTRLTETYENVGSRDFMPPWAEGERVDDVDPRFDVYSLGKTFLAVLAGKSRLRQIYYDGDSEPFKELFKTIRGGEVCRWIAERSVVLRKGRLATAKELLGIVDSALNVVENRGVLPSQTRACRVCGVGSYVQKVSEKDGNQMNKWGIRAVTALHGYRICSCSNCGHVELFVFPAAGNPPWWSGNPPVA
jgi:serine/threonine protein kinase